MAANKNKKKLRAPKVADSELSRVVTDIYDELNKLSSGPSEAATQTVRLVTQSQLPLNPTFNVVTANEFIGNLTGDVTGDLTGAIHVQGKNETGGTLTKGTPVYISGQSASGQNFTIDVADSNGSGTMPAIGILSADVNNNAQGDIVTHGKLIGIDTSSFAVGDELYISPNGTLVNTPPTTENNLLQKIAKVVRVDASSGQIYIMGAGRTNATPNLNQDKIFLGDSNNQATPTALSSIGLSKFNNDVPFLTSYTETDPVFSSSPAAGITTPDITNWNAAYSYSQIGHLEIANNLSDVNNAATSRTNLGLGATNNVTFGTLELGNNTSVNGTIKMWLPAIPDDANITLDNNAGVARFRLDSDTVVEGDLWVDDEVTTARLRTPEITNLAGTAAVWSTSSAVWDTSSLTWTNNVILLNGGISISDTLEVVNGAEFQANVTVNSDLTVLGTTNLASIKSSALTAGRVVLAGTAGVLEDSANLTFNGTLLTVTGNEQITGTLDVDSQTTLSSLNVEDLTSGRVLLAGTSGEVEDSANLTFNGSTLSVTSLIDVTGQISVDNSAASSGNSFEVFGANGTINIPHTGETIQLSALSGGNTSIDAGSDNLNISAAKTFINQDTDVDGALYALTTLTVDGQTNLNSKLVVSDSTASPGDYAIEATSLGALTAKFNSTHPDQGGISISSFSTNITDLIYDSTNGVSLRAHANTNLSFYTEATGVDTLRLKIGNGTGVSAFYGEQFNFGDSTGNSGKVKVITGASGQGEFILNQGGIDQVNLSWNSVTSVYDVKSLGNIRFQTQGNTVAGMWDNGDLKLYESTYSDNFTKGTTNTTGWYTDGSAGFAIEKDASSLYNAYFDTLTVRGTLRVFELIAKQISTIGGTELLTVANGVIESVSGTGGSETVTLEDPNGTGINSFVQYDLVVIQRFNPNNPGTLVKSEWREVVSSVGTTITLQDSSTASALSNAPSNTPPQGAPPGTTALEPGDYIVAFGNFNLPNTRGNIIYRSVLGNPIVRVQEDIDSYNDFAGATGVLDSTRIAYGDIGGFGGLGTGTYGFFAGTNGGNHVTITSTGMQFRNASNVLAELSLNKFVVGDATSYVRFDGNTSKIEMAADTFNLATTNLTIDSVNEIITLGTSADIVSIGKIATAQFGISLDATNYWYKSGGNTYISIGNTTDYLQFDTNTGNLDIAANNFNLATSTLVIDSVSNKIALGPLASSITIDGTEVGFIADGTGEFKGYIDANNYIRLANSALDIKAGSFNLATTNLIIDSTNERITLGSGNVVTLGKISANEFGLSLDTHNFWKVFSGDYFFKVGDANNFISFDTNSAELSIDAEIFNLSAGGLVVNSSIDKKIVISDGTEPIIAIGDFTFAAEVEDTSSSTATFVNTTNNTTNATPTNSSINMDSGFGTYTAASATATNTNFITLKRDYNNARGKWIRVKFDYNAPKYNNEGFGDLAIGFTINYFGKTIQQINRPQDDTNDISGSVDEYLFIPDNAAYSYIQVFALAPAGTVNSTNDTTGGLDSVGPDVHGRINLVNFSVTEISNTYTYTDIGNNGFRVYNSGGRNRLDFTDGKAEGTFETLSIGSWDFVLDSNGNLELQYDGTLVQQFTRPI